MSELIDINEIMRLLPHRYPFLLVDRVTSFVPHKTLTAYKNVTFNENFFQGHFPGRPVMPGVLILEALAQAGGLLVYKSLGPEMAGKVTYIVGADKLRFRRPVFPGDRLDLNVEIIALRSKLWKLKGQAYVGENLVAEGDLLAMPHSSE